VRLVHAAALGSLLVLVAPGCRTAPQRFADHAGTLGMQQQIVAGRGFDHVVFWHRREPSGRPLHVYIDGDGVPWGFDAPSPEPTPRDRLVLELMRRDQGPAVYLGRPCYHGLAGRPPCTPEAWTAARYSEAVVTSMAAAVESAVRAAKATHTVLLGYSGGGTLAVLVAARSRSAVGVVTVAANLDVEAWAAHHGYVPLTGSLNPARQPALPAALYQRHYIGGRDTVVPLALALRGPVPPDTLRVIPDFDHRCCWETIWTRILADLPPTGAPGR
jgi:hypothetical protein